MRPAAFEAGLSADDRLLDETVTRLAGRLRPEPRDLPPAPDDDGGAAGWALLATSGLVGLRVPDRAGGGGATAAQVARVVGRLAEHAVPLPYLGTQVAADALARAGAPDALLGRIATGDLRLALGFAADLTALGAARGIDARGAAGAVVVAGGSVRVTGLGPPRAFADLTRVVTDLDGPVRPVELFATDVVPADLLPGGLADGGRPIAVDDRLRLEAFLLALLAADLVGTARGAFDDALAYVAVRRQFGRPVGAFQAVQHLAADAAVALAAAGAIADHAAWAVDALPPAAARRAAAEAKALAGEVAVAVCETAAQMFGGIAMTWEHLAHVRLRRAIFTRALGGDGAVHFPPLASTPTDDPSAEPPDEAAFRRDLRAWLAATPTGAAAEPRAGGQPDHEPDRPADHLADHLADEVADVAAKRAWHSRLYDAGYVGVAFPTADGGRGLPLTFEAVVNDELGAAGAPPAPPIGHIANALRLFGSDEQRARHLPGLLSGRVRWCQGFSEPNAGSDLAGIATRARRDGDEFVVTGNKIWTSDSVGADWCLLLCRTEPGSTRHAGLSVLLVAMDTPGVEVRPIVTAFGTREFSEVFFDEARVPVSGLLGSTGDGWAIAMSLLSFERGPADVGWISRLARTVADMTGRHGGRDARTDEALGRAGAWLHALRLRVRASLAGRGPTDSPGPAGSVDKLLLTYVEQLVATTQLAVAGADGLAAGAEPLADYLRSRSASILGGTSQIQRDIVAQRVLGLPAGGRRG